MKTIKEEKGKGVVTLIILGLMFLLVALITLTATGSPLTAFGDAEQVYRSGQRYSNGKNEQVTAVKVLDIGQAFAEREDGASVHMIRTEDAYYPLVVAEGDEQVEQMVANYKDLAKKPVYLLVGAEVADYELAEMISRSLQKTDADLPVYPGYYLYKMSAFEALTSYIPALILFGLAISLFVMALLRRRRNRAAYDLLYSRHPELKGNLNLLWEGANYQDEELKVAVYKTLLVSFYHGLHIIDLDETSWLYEYSITQRKYFISNTFFYIQAGIRVRGKYKLDKVMVHKAGKQTSQHISSLLAHIHQQYPEIKLGFTNENIQAFKELKSNQV